MPAVPRVLETEIVATAEDVAASMAAARLGFA
jgi:hypothetical protein